MSSSPADFTAVYGPVSSWRYGKSLGIDPIGAVSVCSFNCVYCQLGEIQRIQGNRQLFIPTEQIISELTSFALEEVDAITLSGSGEPTLAENLGDILTAIARLTPTPTVVLTNGTLLGDAQVRLELAGAAKVAVKVDGVTEKQLRRINRPSGGVDLAKMREGIAAFAREYRGELAIQTMVLTPWEEKEQEEYM
jgi:wyosine [tRNA(Phe)-imidazoG37] synthetase (radical SAM superfamily)